MLDFLYGCIWRFLDVNALFLCRWSAISVDHLLLFRYGHVIVSRTKKTVEMSMASSKSWNSILAYVRFFHSLPLLQTHWGQFVRIIRFSVHFINDECIRPFSDIPGSCHRLFISRLCKFGLFQGLSEGRDLLCWFIMSPDREMQVVSYAWPLSRRREMRSLTLYSRIVFLR